METPTIIVLIALLEYLYFTGRVGANRGKLGIEAPATTGHPEWECMYRIQQNTLEQLIVFIPAIYAFYVYVSETWVWLPGAMFVLGRLIYSVGYLNQPGKRALGMVMTFFTNVLMVLIILGMLVWKALSG